MGTRIKICGMMRMEDIEAVNEAGADFCGLIFAEGRRRTVTPEQAAQLRKALDPSITPVGVFVNQPPALPVQLVQEGVIDWIQLHGEEDASYISRLRALLADASPGMRRPVIIQACSVSDRADLALAEESAADYILLDHGRGGTGVAFDWALLAGKAELPGAEKCASGSGGRPRPFILAGGLHAGNLAGAIARFHPFAVDLSSGVETDGRKDPEKIRKCVQIVRGSRHSTETGEVER